MLSKWVAAATLGAALVATSALAQNTGAKDTSANTASKAQSASAAGLWQGSKLISMNVYNTQDEKIGSIKDMMTNKDGNIELVVIGVGGFLGVGERDVAVKFSEIKWSNEPAKSSTSSSSSSSTSSSQSGTTGAGTKNGGSTTSTSGARTYPDHAIYNASKEQLQALPQFDYNK